MPKLIGIDQSHARRATHRECGAIIEYFETEVTVKTGRDIDGCGYTQLWICCPNCGKQFCVRET